MYGLPFARLLNFGEHWLRSVFTPRELAALALVYNPHPPAETDTTTDDSDTDNWRPDWWPGDEEASAMNAAAAMGLGVRR